MLTYAAAWSCAAHRCCCLPVSDRVRELATATIAAVFSRPTAVFSSQIVVRYPSGITAAQAHSG
jgi:hypothetical protein